MLTKYIEVLQCNNHISSYLCDVVRIKDKRKKFGKRMNMGFTPIRGSKDITCRECPKSARFLVRHKKN